MEPAGYRLERTAPARDLAPFVDLHWHVSWDLAPGAEHVQGLLPFPCVNLAAGPDGVLVHGPITHREDRVLAGRGEARGTRIRAGAFPALAGDLPARRTTDARLTLDEVFGAPGARLAAELAEPGLTVAQHRATVEAFLRARAPETLDAPALLAGRIVDALLAEPTGATRIDDVAARFGLTTGSLRRLFRHHVGLTPTQVLTRSRQREALELGYADQAR
jgi:hypothetical protein